MSPGMMRGFPPWIDNGTFPDLYNTITGGEACGCSSLDEIYVSPLETVSMYIVRDLADEQPLRRQYSIRFNDEWWVKVCEAVAIFLWRFKREAESRIEIFRTVFALVGNMGRIIYHDIHSAIPQRHLRIIAHDRRPMTKFNVHPDYRSMT